MAKKSFTAEFKAKVAIEALKGHKTINELTTEFDVHPTQINSWKKQLIEASKTAFTGKHDKDRESFTDERERLFAQIGQLSVQLDWLKKKTGHLS